MNDVLNLQPGSAVLDMPCGTGRHSIALARDGFQVTAVDIAKEYTTALKKKVENEQLSIGVIEGDILSVDLSGPFDGAICLGNSFGYFSYQGMESFVSKVSKALKQGARWTINTGLMAESFLSKFIKESKYELPGLTMEINNDYDEWSSCLLTTLTYTKDNQQEVHHFKHYVYTVAELIRLLGKSGLRTIKLYSSTNKDEYKLGDAQLYLVAEKTGSVLLEYGS